MTARGVALVPLSILVAASMAVADGRAVDTVLYNGKVVTVDARFTIAEAVAVTRDRIEAVGSSAEILRLAGPDTRRIDLESRTVLPGLIDAHLHPTSASTSELFEEIPDVRTLEDLLAFIEARAREREKGTWIVHPKFFPTRIVEMRQPTLRELDSVAPEHPVFLNGSYGGMINSRAIRICGIDTLSEHPGILRDAKTGEPTGLIRASAFPLVTRHLPKRELSYEQELDVLESLLRRYNRVGLTGITDGAQSPAGLRRYQDLWTRGRLPIRVNVTILAPRDGSREQLLARLREWGFTSGFGNEWVRVSQLKTSLDGGILTGTAWLREPWGPRAREIYGIQDPGYRGILQMDEETLFGIVSVANEMGWKMTAHVTGGGGVDLLLDAYERASAERPIRKRRFSIIHGNFFTPEAMARCRELGVIADVQPAWFYEDGDAMTSILGRSRARWFLPLRSMRDAGVILNGGSDHMVKLDSHTSINPYNPFLGMWIAITRTTKRGTVIRPDEALTREEALRMYTIDNAYGTFEEDVKGSIEPGKLADMIVISEDYLTCPVDAIRTIRVEKTIVGGKVVYEGR